MNIVFDFDSTLVAIESLDWILSQISSGRHDAELKRITNLGMDGKINLHTSITKRLQICSITQPTLQMYAKQMPKYITPKMEGVVKTLQNAGHKVYVVSGGILECVMPVAEALSIPTQNCFANKIIFDASGNFKALDETCPLLYQNGKSEVLANLGILNASTVVVGDGFSDLEVTLNNPSVNFIGFGVNVVRNVVKEKSSTFVTTVEELEAKICKLGA